MISGPKHSKEDKMSNLTQGETTPENRQHYDSAVQVIKSAILQQQVQAARQVNAVQLSLYYGVGQYISVNSRSGHWGKGAIDYISRKLQEQLPGLRGFSATNIKLMRLFYEAWSEHSISGGDENLESLLSIDGGCIEKSSVATDDFAGVKRNRIGAISSEVTMEEFQAVSFTHHCLILNKVKDMAERAYYVRLSAAERLSVSQLKAAIAGDTYRHRGLMPNNFERALRDTRSAIKAVEMFRDEYLLDFINVEELGARDKEDIDERVLENAIVHNIRNFIMTFGRDFSFIGNQYRIEAHGKEHFIDLLFYNRELSSLVAIELKTGPFKAAYLGQLNMYLQLLDDYVRKPQENPSIGIILCSDAEKPYVEYAVRDYAKPMGVAVYRTRDEMPEKLRRALPSMEDLRKLL